MSSSSYDAKAIYDQIISESIANPPTSYSERHHIIPRSLGGTDDLSNIVRLTARDHYRCHQLLVEMSEGDAKMKMSLALHVMTFGANDTKYAITPEEYESARVLTAQAVSRSQKKRFEDPETRRQQVEFAAIASQAAAKKNTNNPDFAKKMSERTRKRVIDGTHNFIGGQMQKEAWKSNIRREKLSQNMRSKAEDGTHGFVDPNFIEENRERLKSEWANMTVEQRKERGRKISEGKKRAFATRKVNS